MGYAPKILIVDDDPGVRKFFAVVLTEDGYAVSSVATGRHALSVLRDRDFDVVILDIGLPDIDGLELLIELRTERPHLKAVIVSGSGIRHSPAGLGGATVVRKPVNARALRRAVYGALDDSLSWLGTV